MTEHVHEWHVDHRWERSETDGEQDYSIYAWCDCSSKEGWYLNSEDIERRLNATDRLSAEDALTTGVHLRTLLGWKKSARKLEAYASALEEE
jgi:hypothetical protein